MGLSAPVGHGVLVYIHVPDAHAAYERVKALDVPILAELQYNPQAGMTEFTVRDPNGYAIGVCNPSGADRWAL